jgi:hypothetical protein
MSPLSKIILVAVISGLFAAVVFVILAAIGLYLFGRNLEIAFLTSADPVTPFDHILILLCLIGVIASLAISPYAAYRCREAIFDASDVNSIRILLFSLIGFSQIIFLALGYFFVLPPLSKAFVKVEPKPAAQTLRRQKTEEIIKKLSKVNIEVICKKAKIISRNGANITAELTLQIKNVPPEASFYRFEVPLVNQGKAFQFGKREIYDNGGHSITVTPLNIEAENENGEWVFYQKYPNKSRLGTNEEFTFRLQFYRENLQDDSLPETITPELKLFPGNADDFYDQYIFFKRPIPVDFAFKT